MRVGAKCWQRAQREAQNHPRHSARRTIDSVTGGSGSLQTRQ
jgi:hypothetical protein